MINIQKIALPFTGMSELQAEARQEGYDFIETLIDEWVSSANRFERPGETLLGVIDQGTIIAVGGLTIDPFVSHSGQAEVGRIRRVYVRNAWRDRGIGRALVTALVEKAREGFRSVRLRAENDDAARLYERIGFSPIDNPDATHILSF
jgi:GNAT superfamily N-acetyltransferase